MEEQQVNKQGQQPGRRRGVRMCGGRVRRQISGRRRRGQVSRHVSDEISTIILDQVLNHDLTMVEAGRKAQLNFGRTTMFSMIQMFVDSTGMLSDSVNYTVISCTYCNGIVYYSSLLAFFIIQ